MDLHVLTQSKGSDAPSGENPEYEASFMAMEVAGTPGEETQIGDEIRPATEPDYNEVKTLALEVLEQSHDLRAAIFLADAVLHTDDLSAFADVTQVIRAYLEEFWDTCHPELDEDDDNDPTMRINAIQGLSGQPDGMQGASPVYRSLRGTALTQSRGFGRLTVRDLEIADGTTPAPENMDNAPDSGTVMAAFQDTDEDWLNTTKDAARRAFENVKAISAVFDEKTPGFGPDLDGLIKLLYQISNRMAAHMGSDVEETEEEEFASDDGALAPAAAKSGGGGAIASRNDVTAALDRIIAYYAKNEPSSPLPILLERAKKLVHADFMTIIQDLAPGGLDNVRLIGGDDS
ncbi:MAG: type VI secretion system protein TssA [Sedimentitalea sp.]